jgi:hypothetical protein
VKPFLTALGINRNGWLASNTLSEKNPILIPTTIAERENYNSQASHKNALALKLKFMTLQKKGLSH